MMNRAIFLVLLFTLLGCRTAELDLPVVAATPSDVPTISPTNEPTPQTEPDAVPTESIPVTTELPRLTVDAPHEGAALAIAQLFSVSGRLVPPPSEDVIVTVYVSVEGGTHPNFDFVTVDRETGEWAIETFLHPKHIGDAQLVIAANSGPDTTLDSGGSITRPVVLTYDDTDDLAYVNIQSPLTLTVDTQPGDAVVMRGVAHNPIDGMVWLRVQEEEADAPVVFEEIVVDQAGMWEWVLSISAEWSGKTLRAEACTGAPDASGVAWCSTTILVVE